MKKIITSILLIIFSFVILTLSIRGIAGNPSDATINEPYWKDNGPLELSPERGKFALTYSFVEDNSVHFSVPIAKFSTPDLGYSKGNYVSLFAPGVAYITIPGYIIGKEFGSSQVGTYAVIALFAIMNAALINLILLRLGVRSILSAISSIIFLFATPAFAYAVSLYQHHISTFIILLSVYLLQRFKGIWPLVIIWFILAISLAVDNPNLFMVFPIGIYALGRVVYAKIDQNKVKVGVKTLAVLTLVTALVPLLLFGWFNKISYGDAMRLGGTVASVKEIDEQGKPAAPKNTGTTNVAQFINPDQQKKSALRFFKTRNILNGFYIHFISPDRGIIYFTPVILLGFIGMFYFYRKDSGLTSLLIAIMGTNILLYSMWGDAWGGWAFGSRYLVPSYAILAIFLGVALNRFHRNIIFILVFLSLFVYSAAINTVGAITSNRNPPQVEVLGLEQLTGKQEKYTYERNFDMLGINQSKSFVFNTTVNKYFTAWEYYYFLTGLIILSVALPLITLNALDWRRK